MSLNTRPTFKDLKDREHTISELKEKIKERASRSRSTSQTRDQNRKSIRKDKELFSLPFGELPSIPTMNILFTDLFNVLKLQDFNEIIPAVKALKKRGQGSDLEERIHNL